MSTKKLRVDIETLNEEERDALLRQRFGICPKKNGHSGIVSFQKALQEFKETWTQFLSYKENIEKIVKLTNAILVAHTPLASDNEPRIQYKINIPNLFKVITGVMAEFGTEKYIQRIGTKLENKELLLVPVETKCHHEHPPELPMNNHSQLESHLEPHLDMHPEAENHHKLDSECVMKGIVFFDDKVIKLNRGTKKMPSITIYKIQKYDKEKLGGLIVKFLKSIQEPLVLKEWDKELNDTLHLEKITQVIKKEHGIGNCVWVALKLFLYSSVYAIVYHSLLEIKAKELIAGKIAISIAEDIYKTFTLQDRSFSLYTYLRLHHLYSGEITYSAASSISERIEILEEAFKHIKKGDSTLDRELLLTIHAKSLNWLLADYLNKGELDAARLLLKKEKDNPSFKPLFYAARNNKLAIAEMLANDPASVNQLDENGNTPIMVAVIRGNIAICRILIKHKMKNQLNLELKNFQGDSALHIAIIHNKYEIAEYLLKQDKNLLEIENNQGKTPLKLAMELNSESLIKLLNKSSIK